MTYACVAEWKSIQVMKIPKNTISNTGTLNPFHPQDLITNSPYYLPYNSYDELRSTRRRQLADV